MNGGLPDGMFLLMTQDELPKTPLNDEALSRQFDLLFQQKERLGDADFGVVTDGYFQALGIPLLRGRLFDQRDSADAPARRRDQRLACPRRAGLARIPSATPSNSETWTAISAC